MKSKLPSSLILLAAILLASCSNATVTSAPHPTGTEAVIPLTHPSTSTQTPLPPAVDVKIKDAIGEQEYNELNASIINGKISGTDYATGNKFEGKIKTETITSKTTADFNFKIIVNAEATDNKTGETFTVVWNPETNNWVKVIVIGTDLDSLAYFNNYDKAVSSRDLNLIVLSQGNNADAFPEDTPATQYWINTIMNVQGNNYSYFSNFSNSDTTKSEFLLKRGGLLSWRFPGFIRGKTSDGKEVFSIIKTIPSSIGNINLHLSMDNALFNRLLQYGKDYFIKLITESGETGFSYNYNVVPVITLPTDISQWNPENPNYGLNVTPFYSPEVGGMQKPGTLFNLLPKNIRDGVIREITSTNPLKQSFQLTGGISPELARALSQSILFPTFDTIFYK